MKTFRANQIIAALTLLFKGGLFVVQINMEKSVFVSFFHFIRGKNGVLTMYKVCLLCVNKLVNHINCDDGEFLIENYQSI